MANSRTKNTLLNTLGGIAVKLVTIVLAFVTRSIFIKTLGIQYAGVSGVFSDILTILSFAELGIGSAITYALYKPIADRNKDQIAKLMNVYQKIYTTIAAVVLGLGLCLLPFLRVLVTSVPDIREDIRLIYLLYLVNSASSYLLIYKSTFLTAAQKDYLVSKMKIIISIFKAVIECVILLAFGNFVLYLLVSIVTQLTQNILIARVAEKQYPELKTKSDLRLEKEEKKKIVEDVKALFLYKVSGTVLKGTDSLVISAFLGTPLVGVLGNYNLISNQIYAFVMQIFTATAASIGNLAATSTAEHQEKVFNKMTFLCFWIYLVCSTCLWTLFDPFITVWQGAQYLLPRMTVVLMVVDFYMRGMLSPVSQFRTSNGLFVQGKYRPLIMAVINLIVSIFLAMRIGITGVIFGTVFSRACTQLWYDPYLVYKYVFHKRAVIYYRQYLSYGLLTVASCAASSTLLQWLVPADGVVKVLVGAAVSLILSNALILLFFRRREEFGSILALVKKITRGKMK